MFSPGEEYTTISAADLSALNYSLVKLDANGSAVLATASTDPIIGVLHDGGRVLGDAVSIMSINGTGTFKVIAGGTIAKDAYLTTNSSGQAVATTTTGDRVFGRAIRSAVANDVVEYVKYNEKY